MKRDRSKRVVGEISSAALFAGIIIFAIGAYYAVVKAGLPYQDPTMELQIRYATYYGVGDILLMWGSVLSLCGAIARSIIWWSCRKERNAEK